MIELIVAVLLQVATISTDASAPQNNDTPPTTTTSPAPAPDGNPGGTGTWDDGN